MKLEAGSPRGSTYDPAHMSASVAARYSKGGRESWARIIRATDDSDTGLVYLLADVGA